MVSKDGADVEIAAREDAGAEPIVELKDPENVVPFPEGHGQDGPDLRTHEGFAMGHLLRRVGHDDRRTFGHDPTKHTAAHGDRPGRGARMLAHPSDDRHVSRGTARSFVVLIAQHDRDVCGTAHQRERSVADGGDHLREIGGRADSLLRFVERPEAGGISLDRGLHLTEVLDLARREYPGRGVVGDGHREPYRVLARAELDAVARLEGGLTSGELVERKVSVSAQDGSAMRRPEVTNEIPMTAEHDAGVLARDVRIGKGQVVAFRPPEPHHIRGRLVARSCRQALRHIEPDHLPPRIASPPVYGAARARNRRATFTTESSAMSTFLSPASVSDATILSSASAVATSPLGPSSSIASATERRASASFTLSIRSSNACRVASAADGSP